MRSSRWLSICLRSSRRRPRHVSCRKERKKVPPARSRGALESDVTSRPGQPTRMLVTSAEREVPRIARGQ